MILGKIRLFSGEVSNDMVEMLKRRDELKFGVLFINRPKVSYLIQWSDFNKNFSSAQIGYVKQGFESSHSGGIE